MHNKIYLDHNSTSPITEKAKHTMLSLIDYPLNASSIHSDGQFARNLVESARRLVLKKLNAIDANLIFTASGTEANNTVIQSFQDSHCVFSAIEHRSILANNITNRSIIQVTNDGVIDLNHLETILAKTTQPILVSIMVANNETGVIQPIKEASALIHRYGAIFHTDAVQALGKISIDMQDIGADIITISAHKIGGGVGSAALIYNKNIPIKPLIYGGGQEKGLRGGTENTIAIAMLHSAISELETHIEQMNNIMPLRDHMEKTLSSIVGSDQIIIGRLAKRLPNTSMIRMSHTKNSTQLIYFNLNGISLSNGSACSSGNTEKSHVLSAMSIEKQSEVIRISMGPKNTMEEINYLIECWKTLYVKKNNIQN